MNMRNSIALVLLALSTNAFAADDGASAKGDHIVLRLLSERDALVPGKTAQFGIELKHDPHWHTYWTNPGDSGLPTKLAWQLPTGYRAEDVVWPTPQRFTLGELATFGYVGAVLLPVLIDVPSDAKPGSAVQVAVKVDWLVCQEECIPGKATLALDIPVRADAGIDARNTTAFSAARHAQPQTSAWTGGARVVGENVEVSLHGADLPATDNLDAFVVERKVVANARPRVTRQAEALVLTFAKSDYFTAAPANLNLIVRTDTRAVSVGLPFAAETHSATSP